MRRADARLNASIITRSSIKLSLTGGQVGWTTNTSWPRTFSLICTYTSPSEKRETSASPSLTCRCWAISSARGRFALPEKIFRSYGMASPSFYPRLAGAGGIEPPLRGPKPRVLPLDDAPSSCRFPSGARRAHCGTPVRPHRPAVPIRSIDAPLNLSSVIERARHPEHRRTAARHQCAQCARRQQRCLHPFDHGKHGRHEGFEVVRQGGSHLDGVPRSEPLDQSARPRRLGAPPGWHLLVHLARRERHSRVHQHEGVPAAELEWLHEFSPPGRQRRTTRQEEDRKSVV